MMFECQWESFSFHIVDDDIDFVRIYIVDVDFSVEPATHIQKHFNDIVCIVVLTDIYHYYTVCDYDNCHCVC